MVTKIHGKEFVRYFRSSIMFDYCPDCIDEEKENSKTID